MKKDVDNSERKYDESEIEKLPTISLVLEGGVKFDIEPVNYLEAVGDKFANRIFLDEKEGAVLGANAMFGKKISFDEGLMKISFSRDDCEMQ